ncbi:PspC domain-containing protein [Flavobacteriaceae bacterium S356]|uniref:PspC domain-containing protein n=1 Tax=Asprobacillus argus TaxID=3076534 RepID=A0ABU3LGS9_9FLAO|nr:PspC domain-containing protein [Flavobacteriaceae bacterium S356]
MNKTININLGGYFFHIDELAYQKLRRYLDAIAKSLSDDPQGKNEIIADIEMRISELLSEKIADARQVVNEQDISDIIKIMGEPEDYAETEEGYTETGSSYQRKQSSSKKLYRDGDDKFIGGVAAGIAHYFDVDVIWIRLAFILFFIGGGFSFLLYIILWILLPEAKTTAEKLQMEGAPVNIDNIEKKIRKEFSSMTDSIKDGASEVTKKVNEGFKKNSGKAKSGFQEFLDTLGNIIVAFFKIIGKFIGVILIIVSASVLISFIIGIFSIGSLEIIGFEEEYLQMPPFLHNSILPDWLLALCIFILAGFPFLILFVLGLRILSSNVRQFSKTTSLSLFGIWVIALLMIIFTGIEHGTSYAVAGNKIETKSLEIQPKDTIKLSVINDDSLLYQSRLRRTYRTEEVYDDGVLKSYSNNIKIDVERSNSDDYSVKIRKTSRGRNRGNANKTAGEIEYYFKIDENKLILNGYFLSNIKNMYKEEKIYITLYIPENSTIYFDTTTMSFLNDVQNTDDIYDNDMVAHYFLMTEKGLDCTDCEDETNNEE